MFFLVLAHPGCPRRNPESRKTGIGRNFFAKNQLNLIAILMEHQLVTDIHTHAQMQTHITAAYRHASNKMMLQWMSGYRLRAIGCIS